MRSRLGSNVKTAFITGGAQGIGAAVAERLAADGCRVIVFDIDAERGASLAFSLEALGREVTFAHGDVLDEDSVSSAFANVPEDWDPPSFLVHCVAGFVFKSLKEANAANWRAAFEPAVVGLTIVARQFVDSLGKTYDNASIVAIASISAYIAQHGYLTYNASKAAVLGATRCLAQELAPSGIRVNSVSPGTVWNERNERYHAEVLGLARATAEASPDHGGKFLLRRFADPAEIAGPVAFLLSEDASFITGTDLVVDGGYLAQ